MSLQAEFSGDQPAECQADEVEFLGWRGIRLANDLVSLVAVPDLGGRVMSLTLGTHEYLFRNPEHLGKLYSNDENLGDGSLLAWKNYGGDKSWPSPQGWDGEGQWAGPPDPVLDTGRYSATIWHDGQRVGVEMVSPPDRRSGLRISRSVSIAPGTAEVRLDIEFENISDRPVRWAIWDVTQMECSRMTPAGVREGNPDAWLYVPTPGLRHIGVPYRVLFGGENSQWVPDVGPDLLGVRYLGNVAKIGVRSSAGWVAFADKADGHVFCPQFEYEPGAEYPDGGSSVECWT